MNHFKRKSGTRVQLIFISLMCFFSDLFFFSIPTTRHNLKKSKRILLIYFSYYFSNSTNLFLLSINLKKKKKINLQNSLQRCNILSNIECTSNAQRNKVILESASTFPSPRTKHNALRFLFFPRFLPPEKIFSYRSIRIIPALHPPSPPLPFTLSPSLLKFAHEFISRSTGWRTRNPGTPVCVCVGFTLWRREHSYFHTKPYDFQRLDLWRKRENEGSVCPTLQPSNPLFPLLCRLAERCDFWIFRVWEKLCKPTHPTIASIGLEESGGKACMIFIVYVSIINRGKIAFFLTR